MKVTRKAAFANVGRTYKSKRQVWDNIGRCHVAGPDYDWSFAEIDEADPANETSMVRRTFEPTHRLFGLKYRTPNVIAKTTGRRIIGRNAVKGCAGVAWWGPARYIVETIVTDNEFEMPVVVMTTHFLRSGRRDADVQREQHFKILQQRINYWHGRDYTVELRMDFNGNNADKVKSLHSKLRILVDAGIDYICVVPADGVKVRKLSTKTVPMNIDGHNGHLVRYSLETKS